MVKRPGFSGNRVRTRARLSRAGSIFAAVTPGGTDIIGTQEELVCECSRLKLTLCLDPTAEQKGMDGDQNCETGGVV